MEKDSRLWMMRCLDCGHERSIWDLGGIRYNAVGNKRKYYRCPKCGWKWHELYKKDEPVATAAK
jgi:DNA-directed RNA polymerase subunit RPC12/RpoP